VIPFESVASATGLKAAPGTATVVPHDAIVVVTDMDDTIKDTNVLDRASAELNTFVNAFRPVAGMPEVYRRWNSPPGPKLHFHVVSAGPWQLYGPLREFTDGENFPPFTWDMRPVDIGFNPVAALRELHPNPDVIFKHKVARIRALLRQLPNPVVLIGDSAEQDPEVYAEIANACPDRVAAVFIRDIPGARARNDDALFRPGAGVKPQRFRTAGELPMTLGGAKAGSIGQCR
jgi:phosphatidate phosphatase APP1